MQLSREVYQLVVRNTPTRTDLITLCSVSKAFQQEAERALYNTLHLRGPSRIMQVFRLLSTTPRLSRLVEALSVFVMEEAAEQEDEDEEEGEDEDEEQGALCPLPSDFWDVVASALREVKKLRFLSVHFEQIQDTAQAWVLGGCQFQLRTFHCDFEWDHALATFLHTQTDIVDLYLTDYRKDVKLDLPPSCITRSPAMSKLSMLECTFSEAAAALVPGRPVTRVKTCFSRIDEDEKRAELEDLLAKLRMSRRPLRAMDLGDESYDEDFTLLLLTCMGGTFSRFSELRYLGTLVLPVDGKKVSRLAVGWSLD